MQRYRRIGCGLSGVGAGIYGGDLLRVVGQRIKVGGAVILYGLIDDAGSRLPAGVDTQIGVGQSRPRVADSKKRCESFIRSHGDQSSTCLNPTAKQCRLRLSERHFAEYNHLEWRRLRYPWKQRKLRNMGYVNGGEVTKTFSAQYLLIVLRELISRCGNDENGISAGKGVWKWGCDE